MENLTVILRVYTDREGKTTKTTHIVLEPLTSSLCSESEMDTSLK